MNRLPPVIVLVLVASFLPTTVQATADVAVLLFGGPSASGCGSGPCPPGTTTITPGGTADFDLYAQNAGPDAALGVTTTLSFPPLTSVSGLSAFGGATCSVSPSASGPIVTCTAPSIAAGSQASAHMTLHLDPLFPWPGGLTATAAATSTSVDPNATNNNATVHLNVAAPIPTIDMSGRITLIALLAAVGMWAIRRSM